jgi:general secretion pathway protein E/type IV pilus assembly protein PilB
LSEAAWREALAETLGTPSIDLTQSVADPAALARIPQDVARRHRLLPVAFDEESRQLQLAMAKPRDLPALDAVRRLFATPIEITPLLASAADIEQAIDRHYERTLSIDGLVREIESGDPASHAAKGGDSPVARLIEAIFVDAVKNEASDIHFEPEAGFLRIRYRIDGILRQIRALHGKCWPALSVRLKVLAGMDIAETRAPQDGRIGLSVSGRPVDLRLACLPTIHGENIVVRILDRQRGIVPLDRLGFSEAMKSQLQHLVARPEGLTLVVGPTGSGKTTTLYALLAALSSEQINVMTLEDPVEYPLALVRQSQVDAVKFDFAEGVRALMRQDPDVILVGEIRDAPTARMALQAAMTGHRVFATLHATSALGAIPRLVDLGIAPELLFGHLTGVLAQRLVRRLCAACKAPADGFFTPTGCPACHHTGYAGRLAIAEVLGVDAGLDELIAARATPSALLRHAKDQGFAPLGLDGLTKARAGLTSREELQRVAGNIPDC